jgi:hypothetical protein
MEKGGGAVEVSTTTTKGSSTGVEDSTPPEEVDWDPAPWRSD